MTRCQRCQRRLPASGECAVHGRPTALVDVVEPTASPIIPPPGWKPARHVATGGMAIVHTVEQEATGLLAILKCARWRERDIRARFEREAEVLRTVGPPACPRFIDHGTVDGWPFILMEYVPGETLASWMARNGERGGLGEILALMSRIAAALALVHRAGFVHRDLKPENIMIAPKGGTRLLDFGVAKPLTTSGPDLTQIGAVVGTVHYASPEQTRTGGVVDQRADIYSFGVIAYEMLVGMPPFTGERRAIEYQHQVVRPPPIRDARQVSPDIEELVLACLAKQVEARPQTAEELQARIAKVHSDIGTMRGVGGRVSSTPIKPLGQQCRVVLAWIESTDATAIAQAIGTVHGTLVGQRGDGLLAAFTEQQHEKPLDVALAAVRDLPRCRIVVHATSALVRRSPQGKSMVYGADVERVATWLPAVPFAGLVLTAAAAELARGVTPANDVRGFFREQQRLRTDVTDVDDTPSLVGRSSLVTSLASSATGPEPMLIGIAGEPGLGKSRVLEAVAEKLRAIGRDVLFWRTRRRFDGDRPDDDNLLKMIGSNLRTARADRIVIVDDADRLSSKMRATLLGSDLPFSRILSSTKSLFEVEDGDRRRIAVELPGLSYADAAILLREQLRPARLIPDVLIERLSIRGAGNPALLVALARDMKSRGAIRRHAGADEWYIAADELDTLLFSPGPSWLATSALEQFPAEIAQLVRVCAGLGARFCLDEIANVTGHDPNNAILWLVTEGIFIERGGWYEFVDADLQDAIYEHALDERSLVHARAYAYWLERKNANVVGWLARLAYHAHLAGAPSTAAACAIALARHARRRGEDDHAELLLQRANACLAPNIEAIVRDAFVELGD